MLKIITDIPFHGKPQAIPAVKTGKLTSDLHLSFLSSKSNPKTHSQLYTWLCAFHTLFPHLQWITKVFSSKLPLHPSYCSTLQLQQAFPGNPSVKPVKEASRPAKPVGKPHSFTVYHPYPAHKSHQQLCSGLSTLSAPIPRLPCRSWWTMS